MPRRDRIYLTCDMEQPEFCRFAGRTAAVFSRRRPGSTTANEDAAALIHFDAGSGVAVVADGLGGSAAGEEASAVAIRELQRAVAAARETGELLRSAIISGIESANREIQNLGIGAMTTLAAVEIDRDSVRMYHIGDSEILLLSGGGRIKLQTIPHSPVGYGVEAGLLDSEEAMHHEERHVVSNVVGDAEMRIEIGPSVPLLPRDTVVLARDGMIDNLHVEEIAAQLRRGRFRDAVRGLTASALQRMTEPAGGEPSKLDDLTLIVLRGGPSRKRRTAVPDRQG